MALHQCQEQHNHKCKRRCQISESIRRQNTESSLISKPGRDTPGALRFNGRRALAGNTLNFRIGNGGR
ncbi:hypothetical protein NEUTE2DRAFT_58949 [Neurospora tetrasperma FGSC 2509]|nr:hypothetical protein NEUTE2DRAFT_58949 [Neurospora tetrasperma FGSC 2509]